MPFTISLETQQKGSFKSLHILSRKLNQKYVNFILIILLPSVKLLFEDKNLCFRRVEVFTRNPFSWSDMFKPLCTHWKTGVHFIKAQILKSEVLCSKLTCDYMFLLPNHGWKNLYAAYKKRLQTLLSYLMKNEKE